jgi:hypothetical protein
VKPTAGQSQKSTYGFKKGHPRPVGSRFLIGIVLDKEKLTPTLPDGP